MVQDRESLFTRIESELLEAQLNRAEVPVKQGGGSMPSGDGHVFIGRRNLGSQGVKYASTYVDELKMYNKQLSEEEICKMY